MGRFRGVGNRYEGEKSSGMEIDKYIDNEWKVVL